MPRSLLVVGLTVLAIGILFQVVAFLIRFAIPVGIMLLVIGGIWLLIEKRRAKR